MTEQIPQLGVYIAIPTVLGVGYMLYEKNKKNDSVGGLVEGTTPTTPPKVEPVVDYNKEIKKIDVARAENKSSLEKPNVRDVLIKKMSTQKHQTTNHALRDALRKPHPKNNPTAFLWNQKK